MAVAPGLLARRLDLQTFLATSPTPIDWLVRGLLARGETVNLAAKWGVGKTWFGLDLALTVADQERTTFLGRPVKHGTVMFLDEESSEDIVRERLSILGARRLGVQNLLYLLNTGMKLTSGEDMTRLYEAVDEMRPLLVVFDSLTRFYSDLDENSASDMARLTEVIAPLSRQFGAAVVLIDHGTKTGTRDASNAARGSGEKSAGVDRTWALDGDDTELTLTHGKVRRGKMPPPVRFRRVSSAETDGFMANGGTWPPGQVGLWHEPMDEALVRDSDFAALCTAIEASGGRMPLSDVVKGVYGGNRDRANRELKRAEASKLIAREHDGKDARQKIIVLLDARPTVA
jgi:hypothetical protein